MLIDPDKQKGGQSAAFFHEEVSALGLQLLARLDHRHGFSIAHTGDIGLEADLAQQPFIGVPVGAAIHFHEVKAHLQGNAFAIVLPVESVAEGSVGALFELARAIGRFDADGVADEEVLIHGNDRAVARAFGYQRQAEMLDTFPLHRPFRSLGNAGGVVNEAMLFLRGCQRRTLR
nr:hypothetical protein RP007_00130 [Rhizobium sp. P007]